MDISRANEAIRCGYSYLNTQDWREFNQLRHGPSDALHWAGAYIARCMPSLGQSVIAAGHFQSLPLPGVVSFSENAPPDADSTANSTLAVFEATGLQRQSLVPVAACYLLSHQGENGGFSTYTHEEVRWIYPGISPADAIGWTSPQMDVTALVLRTLGRIIMEGYMSEELVTPCRRAYQFLLDNLETGVANAYWWSTDLYLLYHLSELCSEWPEHTADLRAQIQRILEEIPARFSNRYGQECPFSGALGLMTLLRMQGADRQAEESVSCLLECQCDDGSWRAPPILRIPRPNVLLPSEQDRHVPEDKGLLTTATVTQALCRFQRVQERRV